MIRNTKKIGHIKKVGHIKKDDFEEESEEKTLISNYIIKVSFDEEEEEATTGYNKYTSPDTDVPVE